MKKKQWLNVAQLLEHFKMEAVVAGIVADRQKRNEGMRPCADAPEIEEAMEYEVTVLDEQTEEHIWLKEKITQLKCEIEAQQAKNVLLGRVRKPIWCGMDPANSSGCPGLPIPIKDDPKAAEKAAEKKRKRMSARRRRRQRTQPKKLTRSPTQARLKCGSRELGED